MSRPDGALRARASLVCATLVGAALALAGCGGAATNEPPPVEPASTDITTGGPPVVFSFEGLDGKPLSTESLAGRISVIGFVTSYDDPALAEARFLAVLAKKHVPRINVALLFLERPDNRPLVEMFLQSIHFQGPAAMADEATIAGTGPFTGLHHVPGVVVLDRRGAEAWRSITLVEGPALEDIVRAVERADRGSPPSN